MSLFELRRFGKTWTVSTGRPLFMSRYYVTLSYDLRLHGRPHWRLTCNIKNGKTEVSLEILNEEKILVKISDNGEGIEEEHLPRLFERFYRVDKSGNRKAGGSGLGLSIVKHIIEAHQEKLLVESKLGSGSEFSFTLQRATKGA